MRRLTLAVFFFSLLAALLVVDQTSTVPPEASAVAGCRGQVQNRAASEGDTVLYPTYSRVTPFRRIRLSANMIYTFCPNGALPAKIKPKFYNFCHTSVDREGLTFGGVKFDATSGNDHTDIYTDILKVPDDSNRQVCRTRNIPTDEEKWLTMGSSPWWTVSGWVVVGPGVPDPHFDIHDSSGHRVMYVHPSQDIATSGWY